MMQRRGRCQISTSQVTKLHHKKSNVGSENTLDVMGMINIDSLMDMNHVKAVDLMYTPLP